MGKKTNHVFIEDPRCTTMADHTVSSTYVIPENNDNVSTLSIKTESNRSIVITSNTKYKEPTETER